MIIVELENTEDKLRDLSIISNFIYLFFPEVYIRPICVLNYNDTRMVVV